MTDWYYADADNRRQGPLAAEELARLHGQGRIGPDTLVWREGLAQWEPLQAHGDVLGLTATAAAPATAPAAPAPDAADRSPYAPPQAALEQTYDYHAGGEVVYAGFWKRVAALMIDSLIVSAAYYAVLLVVMLVLGVGGGLMSGGEPVGAGLFALMGTIYVVYPLVSAAYFIGFETSPKQATLGKLAVGIKVVDLGGRRLGRMHALGRWASHLLCYFTLYIGYVMAAFTQRKQGLHDMAAGILVVDRWAYTARPELQRPGLNGAAKAILIIFGILYALGIVAIVLAIAIPAMQGGGR